MKILITGGKSAQALKLLKSFANDTVIFADYGEVPKMSAPQYYFLSLGERNDDIIAHNLLNHCLNEGADAILPMNSFEIEELQKSRILFEEFNIKLMLSNGSQSLPLK